MNKKTHINVYVLDLMIYYNFDIVYGANFLFLVV